MSHIELGGITLNGAPNGDGSFSGLMFSRLTGWRNLPGARGQGDEISGEHGSFESDSLERESLSMMIRGVASTSTVADTSALLDALAAVGAVGPVLMRVFDEAGVWSRMVNVEAFVPGERWNRRRVSFDIDLTAPDPVRYSEPYYLGPVGLPTRVGGLVLPATLPWTLGSFQPATVTLLNEGAVPVLPVMRITGSAASVSAVGGPREVSFGPFSGELVIDSAERRAWLNGTDVTLQLVRRDWPVVPSGASQDFYLRGDLLSPDVSLTVEYRIGAW